MHKYPCPSRTHRKNIFKQQNRPTKHTPEGKDRHTGQTYRKLMAQLTRFQLVVKSMQTVRGSEA